MLLFRPSGPGKTTGNFKRTAICLGQHLALVLGHQGGSFGTAHISHCLLQGRASTAEDNSDANIKIILMRSRDRSLEAHL
jgi:hypothetical protein